MRYTSAMKEHFDARITYWLRNMFASAFTFWSLVSRFGLYFYAAIMVALGYLMTHKHHVFYLFVLVALSLLLTLFIKGLVGRKRPLTKGPVYHLWDGTSSFPSGHASMSFSFATSLTLLFLRAQVAFDFVYIAIFFAVAFCISLSRIAVGVHYFSDVIVGAFLGMLVSGILFQYLPL